MNITRKLTNAKLEQKRTHNLGKNTQWTVQTKWPADFSCLLLDFDSLQARKYSDFADKKSLMFIGKIVYRMDTNLPTSHLQSMKSSLKLNT
jgi:hypothetical protein